MNFSRVLFMGRARKFGILKARLWKYTHIRRGRNLGRSIGYV